MERCCVLTRFSDKLSKVEKEENFACIGCDQVKESRLKLMRTRNESLVLFTVKPCTVGEKLTNSRPL